MKANRTKRAQNLTLAERSTRCWEMGWRHAWNKGPDFYAKWLGKYGFLYHLPEWPEELLIVIECRYGLC